MMRTALLLALTAAPVLAQDIRVRIDWQPPVYVTHDRDTQIWQPDANTTHIQSREVYREESLFSYYQAISNENTTIQLHPGTTYFEYSEWTPVLESRVTTYYPYGPTVIHTGPTYYPSRRIVIRR